MRTGQIAAVAALCLAACGATSQEGDAAEGAEVPPGFTIENEYGDEGCRHQGPEQAVLHLSGSRVLWSDTGADGTADVISRDGKIDVRVLPEWGVDAEWVSVPDEGTLYDFAALTELGDQAPWLFSSGVDPVGLWRSAPISPDGDEVVWRDLDPGHPEAGQVEYRFDDGRLESVAYSPSPEPSPGLPRRTTVTRFDGGSVEVPEVDGRSVGLDELDAAVWILERMQVACTDPPGPSRASCVVEVVGGRTVGEWLAGRSAGEAAVVPECPG